jgi:hypothetical protein
MRRAGSPDRRENIDAELGRGEEQPRVGGAVGAEQEGEDAWGGQIPRMSAEGWGEGDCP